MYTIDLSGKTAVVFGVANHRSIAWYIAKSLNLAGATVYITYQNERLRSGVEKLTAEFPSIHIQECDVSSDQNIENTISSIVNMSNGVIDIIVHSIAFADNKDLSGNFSETGRKGFQTALEVSAYSLIPIARYASVFMNEGGSIMSLTFSASDRVFPGYNIMGTAKAALENETKQLAYELGPKGIRVNALSPGPLDTLSSRAIHGYVDMKKVQAERSPIQRNITHEEVSAAALFFASNLSTGITGHILPIDGGYQIAGV